MANELSIIPFLRFLALSLCLVPAVACYDKSEVFQPADEDEATDVDYDGSEDPFANDEEALDDGAADEDVNADDATDTDTDDMPADEDNEDDFECAFGKNVSEMATADHLELGAFEHLIGIDALNDFELDQLLYGTDIFDWFDAAGDLDAFVAELDGERVLIRNIELPSTGQTFTHLRFHSRDFEYGFLFSADSLRLVGAVDEGAILSCQVAL